MPAMAAASSLHISMVAVRCSSPSPSEGLYGGHRSPFSVRPLTRLSYRSVVACSRRRSKTNSSITSSKQKKKNLHHKDVGKEEDLEEDALEALFQQLEEDLKNDGLSLDFDDEDATEEELAELERELEEALGDDELLGLFDSIEGNASEKDIHGDMQEGNNKLVEEETDKYVDEEEVEEAAAEEEEEEERPVELKRWQMRRLAYALKKGRRKTNIKNLAADLCLDRAVVLEFLRDPPPDLLLLSAALPDKPEAVVFEPETKPAEDVHLEIMKESTELEDKVKLAVHVLQRSWFAKKRLKKVQVETLERVYRRTKRPTNAMISSIVHVTNLPCKKVVKWFEDRRAEDGVPAHRRPYQRSTAKNSI